MKGSESLLGEIKDFIPLENLLRTHSVTQRQLQTWRVLRLRPGLGQVCPGPGDTNCSELLFPSSPPFLSFFLAFLLSFFLFVNL